MSENIDHSTPGGATDDGQIDVNDRDIRMVQDLRKRFIGELTSSNKAPSDPEDRTFLLALMQQTTATAIAGKKIKADEKAATNNASMVKVLADVVRSSMGSASANNRAKSAKQRREVPVKEVTLVDGHTDIGTIPLAVSSIAQGGDGRIKTRD